MYGDSICGDLGIGKDEDVIEFKQIPQTFFNSEKVVDMKCSVSVTFLTDGGHVYVTGDNLFYSLGLAGTELELLMSDGKIPYINRPTRIPSDRFDGLRVVNIFGGNFRRFFVTEDGQMWGCGSNISGSLGVGSNADFVDRPTKLPCFLSERDRRYEVLDMSIGVCHTIVAVRAAGVTDSGTQGHGREDDGSSNSGSGGSIGSE